MPKTTSKNWDAWNVQQLDLRRRLSPPTKIKSKSKRKVVCTKCLAWFDKELLKEHQGICKKRQQKTKESMVINDGNKQVKLIDCRSLAKELAPLLPNFLLQLIRSNGVDVTSTKSPIPAKVVNIIRSQFHP